MCVFSSPKTPKLPEPQPKDSAIEETADNVVIGEKRTQDPTKKKKSISSKRMGRRLGTSSLQIPLNPGVQSGNLNYPV